MFAVTHWLADRAGFEDLQMSLVQKKRFLYICTESESARQRAMKVGSNFANEHTINVVSRNADGT
jgi:hypothetical protein